MGRIFLALILALLPAGLSAADPKPAYAGAARLYSLNQVTVVYPAAEGEDVETNRLSAERRAAFLRHDHGIEADVVVDGAVDAEILAGNLLLLGWGNRLLDREAAAAPIQKAATARLFLDSIQVAAHDDLLFAHSSPFNSQKELIFWSRIDPELDRMLLLPFFGSDWAVYRDFSIVEQGMFKKDRAWPPRRNPNAEKDWRSEMKVLPARQSSAHYRLHYLEETLDADGAAAILETREKVLSSLVELLGEPPEDFHIALFLYRNGARKEELTAIATNAHSFPARRESHMTVRHARSADPGQEVLLLAGALMGPCYYTALCQGLAFALRDVLGEGALPALAAQMVGNDNLPPIDDLLDEDKLRLMNRQLGMPAIGLLASWLRDQGALERAWRSRRLATEDIAIAMELEPAAVEAGFKGYVERLARDAGEDLAFRQALGEAEILYERGDTVGTVQALEQALQLRPDDPETLHKLVLALKQAGEPERLEQRLQQLVGLKIDPSQVSFIMFGHYQLGMLYDSQGKKKKARAQFEKMLELPDGNEAHRRAREALGALEKFGDQAEDQ
jgi:Flp pilus assembly protein TadD